MSMFLMASFLMIWRLEAMSARGFEGTVLGTLVMPYCSGMGNLIFAFILGLGPGAHGGIGPIFKPLVIVHDSNAMVDVGHRLTRGGNRWKLRAVDEYAREVEPQY